MVDLVLADAAIVGDQALCLAVVVERDIAILGDIDLLRQRILARHLDRDRVVALLERDGLLEEIVEHLVAHQRVIDRAKAAREHRQVFIRAECVARAVCNVMRLVVVVEGDFLRLRQRQLHVRTVEVAAEAVILSPAAVDGNLVVIRAGRQLYLVRIEIMADGLHARRRVRRIPVLRRASLRLHRARQHDAASLGSKSFLLSVLARVIVCHGMRRIVVGECDIVVLEQAQRDVLAIRLAVRAVVDIPRAAHGDLEVVVALRQMAREDMMASAVRLHDGLAIGRIPLLGRTKLILQGAYQNNVSRLYGARSGCFSSSCCLFLRRSLSSIRYRCLVRSGIVCEGHLRVLRELQLHIGTIGRAVSTVIRIPRATDGNLILVIALRQFARILVLAVAGILHDCRTVSRCPVCTSTELRLNRADENNI